MKLAEANMELNQMEKNTAANRKSRENCIGCKKSKGLNQMEKNASVKVVKAKGD